VRQSAPALVQRPQRVQHAHAHLRARRARQAPRRPPSRACREGRTAQVVEREKRCGSLALRSSARVNPTRCARQATVSHVAAPGARPGAHLHGYELVILLVAASVRAAAVQLAHHRQPLQPLQRLHAAQSARAMGRVRGRGEARALSSEAITTRSCWFRSILTATWRGERQPRASAPWQPVLVAQRRAPARVCPHFRQGRPADAPLSALPARTAARRARASEKEPSPMSGPVIR
jgi:hypothetical protein